MKEYDLTEDLTEEDVFFPAKQNCHRWVLAAFAVIVGVVVIVIVALYAAKIGVFADNENLSISPLPTDPDQRAEALLQYYPLIDGHNDLPYQYRVQFNDVVWNEVDLTTEVPYFQTDIPRARKGHLGAQFWSVYVPCNTVDAVRATMEQIDNVYKLIQRYDSDFKLALTADDIEDAFNQGKIASMIGIEGGHSIDSSLGALRMFYRLGVRYMTLTHSCNTPWADSCAVAPEHNGLTDFGRDVVHEMNTLGMLVDLSHVSEKTMNDVLDVTRSPVYFSHSSAFALCNTSRNVPDSVLARVKVNGGVVSVNFYNGFIKCDGSRSNISDVFDHIDHIARVAGVESVGIGADYDGVDVLPLGLEDVSTYPRLVAELIRRGYSDANVINIIGGNTLRVMRANEAVARNYQLPGEQMMYPNSSCRSSW